MVTVSERVADKTIMTAKNTFPRTACLCLVVLGLSIVAASAAAAQEDAESSKDHPMVSRYPGYFIASYDEQPFSVHEFDLGDALKPIEGHYWQISYEITEGRRKAGPLEIARNYLKTFTDRGGIRIYENVDAGGGTMVARLPASGKNVWLEVDISNHGEVYELTIVEETSMEQKVEFTSVELARRLNTEGSVALRGIQFDTGQAVIKPESAAILSEIVAAMTQDAALRVEIQGHTDNVGGATANLTLSQKRADAVKAHLVQHGIAGGRLTTAGLGDTRPVADNGTVEGRATNRRVELVKK
jgi:outer membrane protein OmpA-like peptidoglycan-associated protein